MAEPRKEIEAKPAYRKVVAELRVCEDRYRKLVESLPRSDDERLKSALVTLRGEVKQRRRLEAELLTAVETERQRIGQDLHDDLCQRLGATAIMTSVIATRIAQKDSGSGAELQKVAQLINDTIESCRLLARGLHPVTLASKGLPAALDELAERMPMGINFRWPRGQRITIEPEAALHLYRITEEAVGNAVKHGEAKNIRIKLEVIDGCTLLVIDDDGKGFELARTPRGMGIRNMEYRAGVIGAKLVIEPREDGGTSIRCRLPRPKKSR